MLFMGMLALVGCSDDDNDKSRNERKPIVLDQQQKSAVEAANDIAVVAFDAAYNASRNNAFSPLSVNMGVSMMANGAAGETLDHMVSVLAPGGSLATLNSLNAKLAEELPKADAKSTVRIANSMWLDKTMEADGAFRKAISDYYGAELRSYDKNDREKAAAMVNEWVSKATKGEIPELVKSGDITSVALANAIYFKGEWTDKFDRAKSQPDEFTNIDGSTSTVTFMNGRQYGTYGEINGTRFASIFFGNKSFSITFILPAEGKSPAEALKHFHNRPDFSASTDELETGVAAIIDMKLPRFSIRQHHKLKNVYEADGMPLAEGMSFGGIVKSGSIGITDIIHECKVTVDEDGAVVVASTYVPGELTLTNDYHTKIEFDRPFAFIISETSTGLYMFMGSANML